MKYRQWLFSIAALLSPMLAMAHPGHALQPSFTAGALHPWSGVDHLLAMLAVGIWAAQRGGHLRWAVPVSFVTLMLVGAALGMSGMQLGAVEQGIAASVCVLGLLITTAARLPVPLSVALTVVFAVFHGYAHGTEAPLQSHIAAYMSGFALSTIVLHALGFLLAWALLRYQQQASLRWAGAAMAMSGVALLVGQALA